MNPSTHFTSIVLSQPNEKRKQSCICYYLSPNIVIILHSTSAFIKLSVKRNAEAKALLCKARFDNVTDALSSLSRHEQNDSIANSSKIHRQEK
jgi:hypothetical protein